MKRWKLLIEYDGTNFCGWQRQNSDPSIQQALEEAVEKFSGERLTLQGSGRTDAGVHARAQVAHMDLAKETDAETIRDAVNFHLRPHRISVIDVEAASDDFHARFSATSRTYIYQIVNRRSPAALLRDFAWHVPRFLEIAPMQEAADILLGQHDFSTFRAQNCQAKSPIKTLDSLDISCIGDLIVIQTRARSFLYHQVRNMVGTLTLVGTKQWSLEQFQKAFLAKDRKAGGPTAPAHGLFFWAVEYPEIEAGLTRT